MPDIFDQTKANDVGEWNNNKEMNPAANSSIVDDGLLESEDRDGDTSWREGDSEEFEENKKKSTETNTI